MKIDKKIDEKMDKGFYITGWILIVFLLVVKGLYEIWGINLTSYYPPCAFHYLTGFYCPGCGGTRAVILFLKGHIWESVLYHPFVPYTLILGIWFMISQTVERVSFHRLRIGMHFRILYLWIGLGIILLNCIIKNACLIRFGTTILETSVGK